MQSNAKNKHFIYIHKKYVYTITRIIRNLLKEQNFHHSLKGYTKLLYAKGTGTLHHSERALLPGCFVVSYRQQGVVDRLIAQRIHRRNKEVERVEQQLSVLGEVALRLRVAGELLLQLGVLLGQIGEGVGQCMLGNDHVLEVRAERPRQP